MWERSPADELRARLADHPDLLPNERMRALAISWLVRALTRITAVLALPGGFVVPTWCAALAGNIVLFVGSLFVGPFVGLALLVIINVGGTALEERYLRRVLKRSASRQLVRLGGVSATSSAAAPSAMIER